MPAPAGTPVVVDLLTRDAEWDRSLSLRLNGFSHNGQRVFGVLSEGGKFRSTNLFDYDTTSGKVRLIDLKKRFAHVVPAKCNAIFDVLGTTATGAVVLQLSSTKRCAPGARWLLNPTSSSVQRLPHDASFLSLYEFKDDAP